MKKKITNILLYVFAIVFFATSFLLEKNFLNDQEDFINKEYFHKVLIQKENEINQIIDTISNQLPETDYFKLVQGKNPIINPAALKKDGYSIFIYDKDTLRFWSENTVEVSNNFSLSELEQKIVNLNNGWYLVSTKKIEDKVVVGLVLIKHQYPYKNKFLANDFHPDFELSSSIKISYVSLSYSTDVYDRDNNYLFSLIPTNTLIRVHPFSFFLEWLIIFGVLFLLLALHYTFSKQKWAIVLLFLVFIAARCFMILYRLPINVYKLPIFGPEHFAQSIYVPSLGDLLLNAMLIFFIAYKLFVPFKAEKINKLSKTKSASFKFIFGIVSLLAIFIGFDFIRITLGSLINNSKISFEVYKVLKFSVYSFVGYLIIALLFASLAVIIDKLITFCVQIMSAKLFVFYLLIVVGIAGGYIYYFKYIVEFYSIIFLFILILTIAVIRFRKIQFKYYTFVLIILIITIYTVVFITDTIKEKEKERSKFLVSKLVTERDPIAEHLLQDIDSKIQLDSEIKNYINSGYIGTNQQIKAIVRLLRKKYFNGYWDKYELEAYLCGSSNEFDQTNEIENCVGYFKQTVAVEGQKLPYLNYYYLDNKNGSISYLGYVNYVSEVDSTEIMLFIQLGSKLLIQELGYPELLLDNKLKKTSQFNEYSTAKFKNGLLVTKSGTFSYDLTLENFPIGNKEYEFFEQDGYEHVAYNVDESNTLILSKPGIHFIDLLVSFSYIFVFFNILVVIALLIFYIPDIAKGIHLDFKTKLQISMFVVLLFSILLVGGGTIYYNIQQYEEKHQRTITEKIQSVMISLEQIFAETTNITPDWRRIDYVHLDELMRKLSNVFFADINLYKLDGELLRSSRSEIFERGLISTKMNPKAYNQLNRKNKAKFVHDEKIGGLTYMSVYVPFKNQDNKTLAYLNLPYFTKPGILKKEISNLIVAVVNIYVLLFLISIVIAIFISNKITQPLRLIENKFKKIELGKKYEQIEYKARDEIGNLVKEYNRMVVELAESVEMLAKSERESAWREMAKQIAHEIKNPLTPMKLSVQFLVRSWKDKDGNFERRFERVTNTLVEQIDNLSAIAAEFSNFAKMPKANNKVFNLVNTVNDIILLFENTENVTLNLEQHNYTEVKVFADEKQISRVLLNLIKNGIQAIPSKAEGLINVELNVNEQNAVVSVEDNGTGIQDDKKEAIFTPNFTTKSSGMGMGLAIVKNIVENAKGKIWFETQVGVGTRFFVELPISKEEETNF